MKYKYPESVDMAKYQPDSDAVSETYYGLPSEVGFCSRCIISNQRPNSAQEFKHNADSKKQTIMFDESNVCDACKVN